MKKLRPFQIGLLASFVVIGVLSIIVLSGYTGLSNQEVNRYGDGVLIWGTYNERMMNQILGLVEDDDEDFAVVRYREVDSRRFKDDLLNAIADGESPDLIIMEQSDLIAYRSKLFAIPYETLSARTFKDTYIDGAEAFALHDGIYAFPLTVDPLMMYWNRDIFAASGYSLPPSTWEALLDVTQQITVRDVTRNILQSAVAFGEYRNVVHAKPVILTLLMQSGSRLIGESEDGYSVEINDSAVDNGRKPLTAMAEFYVEFSNPNSPLYSWNRSRQDDRNAFLGEELALYFGFGSEAADLRRSNPNFNFDVTTVPQSAGATTKRAYGEFYGLAILKAAPNPQGAFLAAQMIGRPETASVLSEQLSHAPVHRSAIAVGAANPFRQAMFNTALVARGWLDPDQAATDGIFQEMVESVVSNRQKTTSAVGDAVKRLQLIFQAL